MISLATMRIQVVESVFSEHYDLKQHVEHLTLSFEALKIQTDTTEKAEYLFRLEHAIDCVIEHSSTLTIDRIQELEGYFLGLFDYLLEEDFDSEVAQRCKLFSQRLGSVQIPTSQKSPELVLASDPDGEFDF